jgi:hypothetical protein
LAAFTLAGVSRSSFSYRRPVTKRVGHPQAGPLEFDCHVLDIPDSDQRLVVYSLAPGSATAAAFRRLADGINARPAGFTWYG